MTAPTDAQWSAMTKAVQSIIQRPDAGKLVVQITVVRVSVLMLYQDLL